MNKAKGILLTAISAILFGGTAIMGKFVLSGGCNSAMLTFTRMFFAIPFIYIIIKVKGISLKLSIKELKNTVILCLCGAGITPLLLYSSYKYISVGIATTIHFVYPTIVCFVSIVFFKEKAYVSKIIAIIFASLGVIMFFEGNIGKNGILGIGLALLSGVTYSFYILFMDKSKLTKLYAFKLSFYICVVNSVMMFIYCFFTNNFVFNLPASVWLAQLGVSLLNSVFAISCFQLGVKYIGPSNAAIFSLLEPITSVVLGVLILKESCSIKAVFGCALITIAVFIISKSKSETKVDLCQ